MKALVAITLLFTTVETTAQADPPAGSLDPGFAGDGILVPSIGVSDYASAGLFEAEGGMVIFGDSDNGNAAFRDGIVLRLNPDGSQNDLRRFPAAAFGCRTPRSFRAALRLRDGDLATGGYVQTGCGGIPRRFDVLRLDPLGNQQDAFDAVEFNNQLAYVSALVEQPDGKIVAAGFASGSGFDATTYDIAVARYMADGTPDPSFGTGGMFTFDLEGDLDWGNDMIIDDQGRILVVGYGHRAATGQDLLMLALDQDGALDPTFGSGGVFTWDRAGDSDSGTGLVQLPGGRIVVAGAARTDATTQEAILLGITANGAGLDPAFGSAGVAVVDLATSVAALNAITVGATGWLYVAGTAEFGGAGLEFRDALFTVYRPGGTPHTGFNDGKATIFEFGGQPGDRVVDIAVDETESRILVTGFTENAQRTTQQFGVARFIGLGPGIFKDDFEE